MIARHDELGGETSPSPAENQRQNASSDEAADVRHVSDTAVIGRGADRSDSAEQLEHDPEADDDQGGHLHHLLP